ncbi:Manganese transport system ATP-binding protein MntB [Chlamydiales bacterium SCGC AG-110-M15]|nr:Manganese transport system ATP-binding protein MntB [Chlamydiales bacterium SCGC AG-110-M15]
MGIKQNIKDDSEAPALRICQMTVNYDKTPVLWDVSCDVPRGKLVGIIGPNGAGKTTLLKVALGLITPVTGKVEFFGKNLAESHERVAYVPQKESVDWDFPISVLDLVLMGRYGKLGLFRWPRKADREAAEHYLDMLGMLPYAKRQISQLSGGQQQRAFLARALMQEADVYFMDEPFAGIDIATEKTIVEILHNLQSQGKTLFVVHHDLNTVESYFDWIMILNMHLVASGEISETFTSENVGRAYGKSHALFGEAARLSQNKTSGLF